ncbi:signal peptidase I [uncultured Vagococcus sp.]|uniref:signal peptidase I n=1 Tax=uncultured Vagococcus sp. TaxID=189676 RepID=UPI0028D0A677|nr:signal peptidase I [uncultured Vagococcus sp.]
MKSLLNQISSLLLITLAVLTLLLLLGRAQGRAVFIILSGSMEPTYPVGGLVLTKPMKFEKLTAGDPITFRRHGKENKVVTHRIIEINQREGFARTQGDANKEPDGQVVLAKDVIGKVTLGLPYIGYGLAFLQGRFSQWLLLMLAIGLLISYVSRRFFLSDQSTTADQHIRWEEMK